MKKTKVSNRKQIIAVVAGLGLPGLLTFAYSKEDVGSRSVADADDPYSFSDSSCGSQGAWTRSALQSMQSLYSVIQNLKDNPKCKGKESTINGIVQNFQTAEAELKLSADDKDSTTIESLPGEIDALQRASLSNTGGVRDMVNGILGRKVIKAASLASQRAAQEPEESEVGVDPTTAVRALYRRTNRSAAYGLRMVSQIFTALPTLDECIMGQPDIGLSLIGAATKIGASFGSSGGGAGHELGSAFGGLATMLRDRKFTKAMRQIDERKFWMSVSCLLETTAKNYCEAENAQEMLAYSMKEYARTMSAVRTGMADPQYDNPLEGYYLLTRELPAISNWLSQVKLGSEPRTTADSSQQKEAIDKVNEYWKMKKDIAGTMSLRARDVMALPDLSAQQNGMFSLLLEVVDILTRSSGSQFVFQAQRQAYLPFFLVGLADIPEAIRPDVRNARVIDWSVWMESGGPNGRLQPFFSEPSVFLDKLNAQLKELFRSSDANAAAFFRKRLVVDLQNLVSMTATGQNLTVYQSFNHVVRYLERFKIRLGASGSNLDLAMLGTVEETRQRVLTIMKSYQRMMAIGRDAHDGKINITAVDDSEETASKQIIDSVFLNFNVLYQSDVFLTNRMTTFIQHDFDLLLKRGSMSSGMNDHQRDIMFAAQDHLLQKLMQNYGQDQTKARDDLAQAQTLNDANLKTFEEIFGDTIYLMLEEYNERVHGRDTSPAALERLADQRYTAAKREYRRAYYATAPFIQSPETAIGVDVWGWVSSFFSVKAKHPDLYSRGSNESRVTGGDTRFGDYARVRALVCAHTLAFENRARYYPLCKDAVLESAYGTSGDMVKNLDLRYGDYWPASGRPADIAYYAKKVNRPGSEAMKSTRICAYNRFTLTNTVRMLQDRDQREDSSKTEGEFDFEKEEREAKIRQQKADDATKVRLEADAKLRADARLSSGNLPSPTPSAVPTPTPVPSSEISGKLIPSSFFGN